MARLLLGPLLRHVGAHDATVWVKADAPCEVEVLGCRERTFEIEGHHFALVHVTGLDAATEALRWGVNDLGGTLMEESISRMAGSYHGVRLDPDDLIGAAHRAGRPAAERTTLYEVRRRYERPVLA